MNTEPGERFGIADEEWRRMIEAATNAMPTARNEREFMEYRTLAEAAVIGALEVRVRPDA